MITIDPMKAPETKPLLDETLDTLLNLDGQAFCYDSGHWIRFEVKKVEPSSHRPHGIKYCLTLHDPNNKRLLGYDNAHGIGKIRKKGFTGRRTVYDHKHRYRNVLPYSFQSAAQLIEDFFNDVNEILSVEPPVSRRWTDD